MSAAPGWYPDPAGQPGHFRFWDGRGWSAGTTTDPRTPPPGTPVEPVPPPGSSPGLTPRRRSAAPWIVGAAAVIVALVVAAVLVIRSIDRPLIGGPDPRPPTGTQVCPDAVPGTASPAPPPASGRVSSGKLSYALLPPPFEPPRWDTRTPFGRDVQSQQATVEEDADGVDTWVASVLIARLLAGDGFFGPEQGARVVAQCVVGKFYGGAAVARDDRRNAATEVDGRPAWVIESHLTFSLPNIKTTGETMIIVVVDTVPGEAGLFYASIPDTSPQFMEPARRAQASLRVAD
jgi:hypothetical protein